MKLHRLCLLTLALWGCAANTESRSRDASTLVDGNVVLDGGAEADATMADDAEVAPDAAARVDAEVLPDASAPFDASPSSDAAVRVDASLTADAAALDGMMIDMDVSHALEQQAYVKASNTDAADGFSTIAMSADGNTLVVGAPFEDSSSSGIGGSQISNSSTDSGAVYVFTRSAGAWSQQAYIKASNAASGDHFGQDVALSGDGNTLVVSAPWEKSNASGVNPSSGANVLSRAGAAYIFERSAGTWTQRAYVKASNTGNEDFFGSSIAISADGSTVVVGAFGEGSNAVGVGGSQSDNSLDDSGAAYVFVRASSSWSQQAYIKASNTDAADCFGSAVALSGDGNMLAVGAYFEASGATGIDGDQSDDSQSRSGAVYTFARTDSTWSQTAYIKASNTYQGTRFGSVVSLSNDGRTLAVGSPRELGTSSGVNGDQTIDEEAVSSGAAYVFIRTGTRTWNQVAYVKPSNTPNALYFASSLSLSGDGASLLVGCPYENSAARGIDGDELSDGALYSGAAYLYALSSDAWSQTAYVKASNTEREDGFGYDVAMSTGGATFAVGANAEDSNATGVGGVQSDNVSTDSGAVYIFTRESSLF